MKALDELQPYENEVAWHERHMEYTRAIPRQASHTLYRDAS
jgi:hypothetical protein